MDHGQNQLDKMDWRRRLTAVRDTLSPEEREQRSESLCSVVELHVLNPLRSKLNRPLSLCVYAPFRSEASPVTLLKKCWNRGDLTFAPRILPGREGMEIRNVEALSNWIPGKWGVPEPDPLQTFLIDRNQSLDVVLVPGIAFNEAGGRVGYGGGYYDRLYEQEMSKCNSGTLWIGFAFSNQIVTEILPMEPHDLKLDGLATDEKFIGYKLGGA
jgi:5-formyltetrahydrofolate cyclo-ligase